MVLERRHPTRVQREMRPGGLDDGKSNLRLRNVKMRTILFLRKSRSAGMQVRGRGGGRDLMVEVLPSLMRGRRHSSMTHRGAY